MKRNLAKIIVIVGPTATGKSDLAVRLARRFGGEVVSADSRQVYRGLDVGSGKITKREMKGVPHHMLDIARPATAYTVDAYTNDAGRAIADILRRGRLPIVAGGTGFYIDALVRGEEFPHVPPDQRLRKRLSARTPAALMKEIARLDPKRARSLDPFNKVRIIRAIEIARALGSVPRVRRSRRYDALYIGIALPSAELRAKIHARLLKRMRGGRMEKEVARLHASGLSWNRLYALGLEYRYVSLYLRKKLTKKDMLAKLETEIAQYARRQMQWFRRNKDILWFEPKDALKIESAFGRWIRSRGRKVASR